MTWYCFLYYAYAVTDQMADFLSQLFNAIKKYNITAENLYNWDEKGFLIGQASAKKRVIPLEALKSGRVKYACQDSSREFISLLACICADGTSLPPSLIYKGESRSLQDTWLEDWTPKHTAHFAASPNGWSCNALGLNWLQQIFDRYTSHKSGN